MRRPMPEASSPAPSRAMPGTSKPVRGSSAEAAGAGEGGEGVVPVVEELFDETGGWLLSGGPVVWLLGACLRAAAEVVVVDFWDFFDVPPKGSVYWSSPA